MFKIHPDFTKVTLEEMLNYHISKHTVIVTVEKNSRIVYVHSFNPDQPATLEGFSLKDLPYLNYYAHTK